MYNSNIEDFIEFYYSDQFTSIGGNEEEEDFYAEAGDAYTMTQQQSDTDRQWYISPSEESPMSKLNVYHHNTLKQIHKYSLLDRNNNSTSQIEAEEICDEAMSGSSGGTKIYAKAPKVLNTNQTPDNSLSIVTPSGIQTKNTHRSLDSKVTFCMPTNELTLVTAPVKSKFAFIKLVETPPDLEHESFLSESSESVNGPLQKLSKNNQIN